jgi:hypothetical protein
MNKNNTYSIIVPVEVIWLKGPRPAKSKLVGLVRRDFSFRLTIFLHDHSFECRGPFPTRVNTEWILLHGKIKGRRRLELNTDWLISIKGFMVRHQN